MNEREIGIRVRRLRSAKAWTQENLADAAGVSPRTVQRAEDGQMSAETLRCLARAFDVPVEKIRGTRATNPAITPVLFYQRPETLDWLADAFGFEPRVRIPDAEGRIVHGELYLNDARIIVGQPVRSRNWTTPEQSGVHTQSVFVRVEDADAHYRQARTAGAEILQRPEDMHGDRRYLAADPEGHHWWFFSPIGDRP